MEHPSSLRQSRQVSGNGNERGEGSEVGEEKKDDKANEEEETPPHFLVRIEHFCWVLAPAKLCEAVTGVTWAEG